MRLLSRTVRPFALAMVAVAVMVVLLPSTPVDAQQEGEWLAEYFGNMDLEGPVLYTETLPGPDLKKEWPYGEGPRRGGVPDDMWSARFTTLATFPGGNVKFFLNSDDGSRMLLNGYVVLDEWHARAATWYEARVLTIPAGTYVVTVEYYDHSGPNSVEAGFRSTTDLPTVDDETFQLPDWALPGGGGQPADGQGGGGVPADGQGGGGAGAEEPAAPAPSAPSAAGVYEGEWLAEYFGNMDLEGPVLYTETLPGPFLEKVWPYGEGPRRGGVPDDMWSARFTTLVTFPGGNVKFFLNSDDGSRMLLNGYVVLDQWKDRAATWFEARVLTIPAGTYVLTVEYYDHAGANSVAAGFQPTTDLPAVDDETFQLPDWALPGAGGQPADGQGGGGTTLPPADGGTTPPAGPGTVPGPPDDTGGGGVPATPPAGGELVDDGDKAFSWSGSEDWGFGFGGFYNNRYLYTGNSALELKMWARWNPYLSATGYWDVYVYIPVHANATTNARYRVSHAGILSPVIYVNQSANAGAWVWLGAFWFNRGASQYLYLNDLTFEPANSHDVVYDAAKFVYSGSN
jgi:hypothetical protein